MSDMSDNDFLIATILRVHMTTGDDVETICANMTAYPELWAWFWKVQERELARTVRQILLDKLSDNVDA